MVASRQGRGVRFFCKILDAVSVRSLEIPSALLVKSDPDDGYHLTVEGRAIDMQDVDGRG